jgi:hypothetical protein
VLFRVRNYKTLMVSETRCHHAARTALRDGGQIFACARRVCAACLGRVSRFAFHPVFRMIFCKLNS